MLIEDTVVRITVAYSIAFIDPKLALELFITGHCSLARKGMEEIKDQFRIRYNDLVRVDLRAGHRAVLRRDGPGQTVSDGFFKADTQPDLM